MLEGERYLKRENMNGNVIKVSDKLERHCLYNVQHYIQSINISVRKPL